MYRNCFILIILFFNVVSFQSIARGDQTSFAVDLIHQDSPESPFYNQSLTPSELLAKDRTGVNGLNSSSTYKDDKNMVPSHQEKRKLFESGIIMTGKNYYVIKIFVGSDKVPVYLYVDLTSNFMWTKCGTSKESKIPYHPGRSTWFSKVAFDSSFCAMLGVDIKLPKTSDDCSFKYKDTKQRLKVNGIVINDRFYFSESQTDAHEIKFGCDVSEQLDQSYIGVLGLGRGLTSFISQLRSVTKYKFSYCLLHGLSKIIFGDVDKEIERTLVSSSIQPISDSYYLNLESIEVGDSPIDEPFEDGMIQIRIDLGTKWTFLEESVYEHVENKVREIVQATPTHLPGYGLCYEKVDLESTEFSIVFHFKRKKTSMIADLMKASITINSKSLFAQENVENGVKHCMTIRKLGDGETHSVLGSLAQINHVMQFDLTQGQVSYAPMDCNLF